VLKYPQGGAVQYTKPRETTPPEAAQKGQETPTPWAEKNPQPANLHEDHPGLMH